MNPKMDPGLRRVTDVVVVRASQMLNTLPMTTVRKLWLRVIGAKRDRSGV